MNNLRKLKILAFCLLLSTVTLAQVTLRIGDQAPPLKYSKWIQGTPVTTYEMDHLYVFEFWATWCGPCVAAMPHLSELSEKFKGKTTFVGFNIWEKTGDKPYESSLPNVTSFVKNLGSKLTYNVAADNNEQHMGNKWMKAAGQYGIPATFLVKEGKIIWIGHPMKLDSIIPLALSGKYDMDNFKKNFEKPSESTKMAETLSQYYEPAMAAIKAKEFDKALDLLDKAEQSAPKLSMVFKRIRVQALLKKDESAGINYMKEWIKENPDVGSTLAGDIIGLDGLNNQSYAYAAELFKPSYEKNSAGMPLISHMIATAYAKAGDYKNAISAEQKAVEQAKVAVKDGKFKEMIVDSTIPEYEAALKAYQEKGAQKSKY